MAAILDHLSVSVPVLAAGGVSCGRAMAAVLAAGACGAWLGTAFCACTEILLSDRACRALLAAQDTDTVSTRVFDIAQRYPWPAMIPERVLRNRFTDRWHGHEKTGAVLRPPRSRVTGSGHRRRQSPAGTDQRRTRCGDAATVRPAAKVIDQLCAEAARQLDRRYTP